MFVFLLVVVSLLGLMNYYVFAQLLADPSWPAPVMLLGGSMLLVLTSNLLFVFFTRDRSWMPRVLNQGLTQLAYVWLGLLFVLNVSIAFLDVLTTLVRLVAASWLTDVQLARVAAVGAGLVAGVLGAIAIRNGVGMVRVHEVPVALKNWPAKLSGYKIVQLSDVHIGPVLKASWLERVVERVNAQEPDLVVITGDLVDGPVSRLGKEVEPLSKLRAKDGVFFVTGNHEFYSGVDQWLEHLPSLGLNVLAGTCVGIESEGQGFDLLGIHDRSAHRFGDKYAVELSNIVAGRDASRPLIALAHQPASVKTLEGHGVDLQISGHTHGGQIWPFSALVKLDQPYVAGLYQHDERMQVYVSRGTGFWGPPMRLLAPAEITKLVLSPAPCHVS